MSPSEYRLRVAYGKLGRLRWLSHLEVVHSLERIVRRATLPHAVTQGFSPHLKAAYGPALPVGTAGEREYFDVWLREYTGAADVLRLLRDASPEELAPSHAAYVGNDAPSLTAALTIGQYRVELDRREISAEQAQAALDSVLSTGELEVEHRGKTKVFDLARSIPKDVCVSEMGDEVAVDLTVRMGPQGSLRPETLIRAAAMTAGIDVSAVRTTRRDTLVEVDEGVWSRPV